jgi:hypothetical protein
MRALLFLLTVTVVMVAVNAVLAPAPATTAPPKAAGTVA